eukprot:CAMPEP_0119075330 /NCGR_PEP_ID=MMETSP1178-20130426/79171_1 /TAXON_ID=33656 /ORGANISM="unid sp, Strain CCMP2000" /LENGTH=41 /DNA_ID= /DNA_START= /DNA_END= /DNA_ORIENTATION=
MVAPVESKLGSDAHAAVASLDAIGARLAARLQRVGGVRSQD